MKKFFYVMLGVWLPHVYAVGLLEHINKVRALHAYKKGDYAAAQERYETLLIDEPRDEQVLLGLGNTCYAQQNYAQAADYYRLIMQHEVDLAKESALFNLGCAQVRLEQLKEALASFEEVVRMNATNQRAQKNCEILRKMLQQQKSGKNDNKKSSKEPSKQSDKENQSGSDQNNGQQGKQQDRDGKNAQADQNKRQRDKADQQKQSHEKGLNDTQNNCGGQQQDRASSDNEHEQRKIAHQQAPANGLSDAKQYTAKKQDRPLDRSMQAILQQAGAMEKESQRMYLQALAGQKKTEGSNVHTW